MGRPDSDPPERESWVQTNTEFHQDWNAHENRHVRWRSGLSIDPKEAQKAPRRYPAQVALRRSRTGLFVIAVVLFAAALALVILDSTGTVDLRRLVHSAAAFLRAHLR